MNKFRKSTLIAFTIIGTAMISLRLPIKEDYFEMSKQLEILNSAFRELNIFYVDPLSPGDLMQTGIDAMLLSLDPYTDIIQNLEWRMSGSCLQANMAELAWH